MMDVLGKIGIIGGTGWLGNAMIQQMLAKNFVEANNVWIANRSGRQLEIYPNIRITQNNQELIENCDTIIFSLRPQDFLSLNINVQNKLVISVMANISIKTINEKISTKKIVRAIPNAAAEIGLSYTPWFTTAVIDYPVIGAIEKLFNTFGKSVQVSKEDQIDFFTALTGSGQGWVAFFESCLIQIANNYGLKKNVAEEAIRQLFLGMGVLLSQSKEPIVDTVNLLIDYKGTTAAGLMHLQKTDIFEEIKCAIDASYKKAKSQ
jgi:pyrroline-5-carboxylate reductase